MKRFSTGAIVLVMVVAAFLIPRVAQALPFYDLQTIWNNTGGDVNDLHIAFKDGLVSSAKTDLAGSAGAVKLNGMEADFTFDGLANNRPAGVVYTRVRVPLSNPPTAQPAVIDKANSNWTFNGIDKGGISFFYQVIDITIDQFGMASATFTNLDTVALNYSNVALYKNNDVANLNLDQFNTPTGVLLTGLPTSFSLLPNESLTLSFGQIDPSKYPLVLADFEASSDPGTVFQVASATIVPEPATLGLLCTGLLPIALRRRRRRTHS